MEYFSMAVVFFLHFLQLSPNKECVANSHKKSFSKLCIPNLFSILAFRKFSCTVFQSNHVEFSTVQKVSRVHTLLKTNKSSVHLQKNSLKIIFLSFEGFLATLLVILDSVNATLILLMIHDDLIFTVGR